MPAYLDECRKRDILQVRIVHGRGRAKECGLDADAEEVYKALAAFCDSCRIL